MPTGSIDSTTALRKELNIHATFGGTRILRTGLDSFLDGAAWSPLKTITPSDYWDGTIFTSPTTLEGIALRTKAVYNCASFKMVLPQMPSSPQYCWFGLEDDGNVGAGVSSFRIANDYGVITLNAMGGGSWTLYYRDITAALPADYATVEHRYDVQVLKPWTEFYIDDVLVALIINSPNLGFSDITYPPYAIRGSNIGYITMMPGIIQLSGRGEKLTWTIDQNNVRFANIDPLPPRVFRVYDTGTDTLWAGMSVTNLVTVTSHPVPMLGFMSKSIDFEANCAGTLFIDTLMQTDNWAVYPPVVGTAIVANTLESFQFGGEEVIIRLRFTPGADGTITDAEVHLE